jgi:hypothetical protein
MYFGGTVTRTYVPWDAVDFESARRPWLVGFFPVSEGMEKDLASKDIVAKAILSPPYAPLTFARFYAFQLFDGLLA